MTNQAISALPVATTISNSALIPVVDSATNYAISFINFSGAIAGALGHQLIDVSSNVDVDYTGSYNSSAALSFDSSKNAYFTEQVRINGTLSFLGSTNNGTIAMSTDDIVFAGGSVSENITFYFKRSDGFTYLTINSLGMNGSSFTDINNAAYSLNNGTFRYALNLADNFPILWSSTTSWFSTPDLGLIRDAASVLQINNGTTGTYAGLKLASCNLTTTTNPGTPSTGLTAWSDGTQLWTTLNSGAVKPISYVGADSFTYMLCGGL